MANDSSINRVSLSDSVVSPTRKKQNSGIDVSQQSFFEELLTIGLFTSDIPKATAIPLANHGDDDGNSQGDANKKVDSDSNKEPTQPDEAANSSQGQAAVAAQAIAPQIQQATPQVDKESASGDKGDKSGIKAIRNRNGDGQADPRESATGPADVGVVAKAADENLAAPVNADNLAATTTDAATSESGSPLTDGDVKSLTDKKNPLQSVQKGRAAADSSDGRGAQTKSESDSLQLVSKQKESNTKPGISLKEFGSEGQSDNQVSKSDSTDGISDQPRNKRAERLAQRASEGGTNTDDREIAAESSLELQPKIAPTPIDSDFATNTSSESSLQTSTTVPPTTTPVIAQPIMINTPGASTVSSSKSSVESIVGVNASGTASGSQAGVSNTTVSGSFASPGRADQGRSEVSRSNSGTQISAYQEGKLVQRVLRGIEQLANGGGQVRLRLHPPELGALQMSLRMEGGQVFAKLEVENTIARDALLNNVQTLKDRLADQGMKVAAFEVEVSTDSAGSGMGSSSSQADGGSGNQSRWENSSSRFVQQNSNRLPTEPAQTERKPNAGWTRNNGSLDLTV
ncbi:MAG: flagellar hook-length control protein FliK [Planctomycetota bacterium]|nr:flagellar hook-length control protein FliK [Planctomycetota bacterium]